MLVEGNQFFVVSVATVPKLDLRQIVDFVKDVSTDSKVRLIFIDDVPIFSFFPF